MNTTGETIYLDYDASTRVGMMLGLIGPGRAEHEVRAT